MVPEMASRCGDSRRKSLILVNVYEVYEEGDFCPVKQSGNLLLVGARAALNCEPQRAAGRPLSQVQVVPSETRIFKAPNIAPLSYYTKYHITSHHITLRRQEISELNVYKVQLRLGLVVRQPLCRLKPAATNPTHEWRCPCPPSILFRLLRWY